ncbi:MAG: orotate phosphoribosyltransferase [Flavobacteriales bacterium]|jgi:orotate phosphoribosyltransferase|nr:orotate phosphoribosyltransferase [Flavobacteriales bacterium]MBT5750800.1 orotate phosphoribosyltransferase [Flavobacteriales bacterium]
MIYDIDIAKQVAKSLLQINAIILKPNNPFKWAAGWNSPIYCDNRKTLSYPEIRNYIKQGLSTIIKNYYQGANVIAGVATAGIPHGSLVAEGLGLPFIYVRAKAKEHGKQNQIEGYFEQGQSVVLVEDLISSGKSSLDAATVLREAGMHVKGMVSIFTYGFDTAIENFKAAECEYVSLCDYNTLLPEAIKSQHIEKTDLAILKQWRENPSIWKK